MYCMVFISVVLNIFLVLTISALVSAAYVSTKTITLSYMRVFPFRGINLFYHIKLRRTSDSLVALLA